jgi:drug/metabolite transporter (DMT)-like permease
MHEFKQKQFWIGFVGSSFDLVGMIFMTNAFSCGPAGPASAMSSISSLFVIIIEALVNRRMLTKFEFISTVLGFAGTLILIIPDHLIQIFCCRKEQDN